MPIFHGPPTVPETIFDNNIFDTLPPPPNPRIEPGEVFLHPIEGQVTLHETDGSVSAGR